MKLEKEDSSSVEQDKITINGRIHNSKESVVKVNEVKFLHAQGLQDNDQLAEHF